MFLSLLPESFIECALAMGSVESPCWHMPGAEEQATDPWIFLALPSSQLPGSPEHLWLALVPSE